MITPVGYLVSPPGIANYHGHCYDYIMGGNGLFIEASSAHLSGRVQVCEAEVRGLRDLAPVLEMKHGRVPAHLLDLAHSLMIAHHDREVYAGIRWSEDGSFKIYYPDQEGFATRVSFTPGDDVIIDLHSHPGMPARFSRPDDKDEQGFRIYGVIGHPGRSPQISLRLGIYGYWCPLRPEDVFEGNISSWEASDEL